MRSTNPESNSGFVEKTGLIFFRQSGKIMADPEFDSEFVAERVVRYGIY